MKYMNHTKFKQNEYSHVHADKRRIDIMNDINKKAEEHCYYLCCIV